MKKKTTTRTLASLSLAAALLLAGCADTSEQAPAADSPVVSDSEEFLIEHGLEGRELRELVDELDRTPLDQRSQEFASSITSETLILSDQNQQTVEIPLPEDFVYVSVAPYIAQTHECYNHNLTGCVGELQNEEITVSLIDSATGEAVLDEVVQTYDNGFVGFWVPRNLEGTLTITHDGLRASEDFSTVGTGARTCITTMQLT